MQIIILDVWRTYYEQGSFWICFGWMRDLSLADSVSDKDFGVI